jgi:cytochrome c biogenesis protein
LRTADGDIFRALLRPGQTVQLPDGRGSITFERLERFAGLSIRHDPGKVWALGAAIAAMLGLALSLFVPRRRLFVRVREADGEPGRTLVEVGALARGEDSGLEDEIDRTLTALPAGGRPAPAIR